MNKVILIGNLGRDPELRSAASGLAVANMALATVERYTKEGQKVESTDWHNLVAFSRLAEICGEYLKKGSRIAVEGKLQTSSWEAEDGSKRYKTQVVIGKLEMLGDTSSRSQHGHSTGHQAKKNSSNDRQSRGRQATKHRTPEGESLDNYYSSGDDDIPF